MGYDDNDDNDEVIWLQLDARYAYMQARQYRVNPAHHFIAVLAQRSAASSAELARAMMIGDDE
jgi:hypothetical protein